MLAGLYDNVSLGLTTALSFNNLLYCLIGVSLGTFIGIIPGFGTLAAMSMLFPITFYLDPTAAIIMLAGIWYGTTYGGSTASILLNLPGTPANAVVCLDGFPMAKQGRAGVALFMTTIASFFGASVGILLMMLMSPLIVELALQFGAADFFSMMVLGLIAASVISDGSAIKGLAMVVLGLLLGCVGMDVETGAERLTFGITDLWDGVSLVALAMGLFGIAEVVSSIRSVDTSAVNKNISLKSMLPTRDEMRRSWMPMVRGSSIGSFFGILPGTGPTIAAFMAYAIEKRVAKDPSRFGKGAIEGIMAPETANNATDQTSFIPTMTLGIPGTASMALILGVLIIHGITPGPQLVVNRPDLFWGLVMSFWIGNILLLVLNIPLIGLWVRVLTIPYQILYPTIIMFVCIGVYTVNNNPFDVLTVIAFGALGYGMRVLDFPAAPLLLGFVLGPLMEENFRRAMVLSRGSFEPFIARPLSLSFLLAALALLIWGLWDAWRRQRKARPVTASG